MTEPPRHRRRRRSGRGSRGGRSVVAIGSISAIVIVGVALSIVLSGGGTGPSGTPPLAISSDLPLVSNLPLVTPRPTFATSFPPVVSASPTPIPTPNQAIKAKRIEIARLGIDLKIVEGDGIDAPIGKAAHYPGTGWPDGGTNIYIYGHAQTGMFLPLWDSKVGDQVVLTLVDGTQRTYVVDKVVPKAPWDAVQYLDPTPAEQLTLQTSTSYLPTSPRFIVIANPAP